MACFPEVGTPLCAPRSRVRVEAARRRCRPYLPAADAGACTLTGADSELEVR